MQFSYKRSYRGPIQAVILDWAGTMVDFGSCAPTAVFQQVFAKWGVPISPAEAREPMGKEKQTHIRQITQMSRVRQAWQEVHGRFPTAADVQAMYDAFIPLQIEILADYATPIPGVLETIAEFRRQGLKIGSCTGYNRQMMDVLVPAAAAHGIEVDAVVCADDVPAGRPFPWMLYQLAMALDVYPMSAIVKIGDTIADVEEGLNAGAWSVGVAVTGNEIGLDQTDLNALDQAEFEQIRQQARARLARAGAHYVVDSVADALGIVAALSKHNAQNV